VPAHADLRNKFGIVRADRVQGRLAASKLPLLPQEDLRASGAVTLTTTPQDVPGCSYTVEEDGTYQVDAAFSFMINTTGVGVCIGGLYVNGVAETGAALFNTSGTGIATPAQSWLVDLEAGDIINLQVSKFIAAGVASSGADNTGMVVRRIG
jgi:hypothetical protein